MRNTGLAFLKSGSFPERGVAILIKLSNRGNFHRVPILLSGRLEDDMFWYA